MPKLKCQVIFDSMLFGGQLSCFRNVDLKNVPYLKPNIAPQTKGLDDEFPVWGPGLLIDAILVFGRVSHKTLGN